MITQKAIQLLQDLIQIESFSKKEDKTADRIEAWFTTHKIPFQRQNNNVLGNQSTILIPNYRRFFSIRITIPSSPIKLIHEIHSPLIL